MTESEGEEEVTTVEKKHEKRTVDVERQKMMVYRLSVKNTLGIDHLTGRHQLFEPDKLEHRKEE